MVDYRHVVAKWDVETLHNAYRAFWDRLSEEQSHTLFDAVWKQFGEGRKPVFRFSPRMRYGSGFADYRKNLIRCHAPHAHVVLHEVAHFVEYRMNNPVKNPARTRSHGPTFAAVLAVILRWYAKEYRPTLPWTWPAPAADSDGLV